MDYTAGMRCDGQPATRGFACAAALVTALALGCADATNSIGRLKAEAASTGDGGRASPPKAGSGGSGGRGGSGGTGGRNNDQAGSGATNATSDGTGGDAPNLDGTCAVAAERKRLDLYFMIDNNITLPGPLPWTGLVQGAIRYVEDPRATGTGVGIDYFGLECTEGAYASPTVPVDLLPGNAPQLTSSLMVSLLTGLLNTSPMLPALGGAVRHAASLSSSFGWKAAVVLVSDGYTSFAGCPSAPVNVVQKASDGFRGSPSVETYVVAAVSAFTGNVSPDPQVDPLDDIARAGGTGKARRVDMTAEAQLIPLDRSAFADTLVAIQREAEPCDYRVPTNMQPGTGYAPLAIGDTNPSTIALPQRANAAACADAVGYYFAPNGAAPPAWAVLCPTTCAQVKKDRAAVWWMTRCATN
jgi:hypothetical protein